MYKMNTSLLTKSLVSIGKLRLEVILRESLTNKVETIRIGVGIGIQGA